MNKKIVNYMVSFTCLSFMLLHPITGSSRVLSNGKVTYTAQEFVQIYLLQDCGSGDKIPSLALKNVVLYRGKTVPILFKALKEGPSIKLRNKQKQYARESYSKIKKFINQDGLSALKNQDIVTAAKNISKERYIDMRMRSFVSGYKERALNGLLSLDDPKVNNSLKELNQQSILPKDLKGILQQAL